MSALPHEPALDAASPAKRRRRALWIALATGLLAAVVAGAIVGARAWIGYQPLTAAEWSSRGELDGKVWWTWPIRNEGRFDVRVTAVEPATALGIVTEADVRVGGEAPGRIQRARPFRPFTLEPGEAREIAHVVRIPCPTESDGIAIAVQQRVHFRVLGRDQATWIGHAHVRLPPVGFCR